MAVVRPIITNWTAGEFSPQLYSRVDLQKYGNAAAEIYNFVVRPHGGVRRRGGTKYIRNTRLSGGSPDQSSRLVPFVFSTTQAYLLEFGANYIRFFKDRGIIYNRIVAVTGVTRSATTIIHSPGHGFSNGDPVILGDIAGCVQLNNREVVVQNATANTFEIGVNSTNFGAYTSGGTASRVYEIGSFYDGLDVSNLQFTQNADTLFIFHPDWPIGKLVRNDHSSWTFSFAVVEEGPFLDMNANENARVSVNVSSGSGIMSCPVDIFEQAHVGSVWRIWEKSDGTTFGYTRWSPGGLVNAAVDALYEYQGNVYRVMSAADGGTMPSEIKNEAAFPTHTQGTVEVYIGGSGGAAAKSVNMRYEHSGYCLVRINSVIDTRNVNVTLLGKYFTPYTALAARSSSRWQEGSWSDKRGYPRAGSFHEQRFIGVSTPHQPATVWASKTASYLNFQDGAKDDRGWQYTLAADQIDAIKYISSGGRGMVLFTTSSEYVLRASRVDEAITPTNVRIGRETSYGIANVEPLRIGPVVLFAQRAGDPSNPPRRIREHVYNFQSDSYVAPDLTLLSEHLSLSGIIRGAFQQHPDMIVWYVRSDGALIGMTYERDQQVVGWHQHHLGGTNAEVEDAVTLPGVDGDEIYLIVRRTVNGVARRYIELLTDGLKETDELEDSTFLDSFLSYSGAPVSNVAGMTHLEGEFVSVLADGNPVGPLKVTNGVVTLPRAASKIHVGYNYTSRLRTLRIEAGAPAGSTAQARMAKISEVAVRFHRTLGGLIGPSIDQMSPIQFRDPSLPMSETLELFSGDKLVDFDADYDRDQFIVVAQRDPLPMHILCLMPQLRVN